MATIRVNDEIKKEVMPILDDLGVSLTEAINMFLHQIKITNSIPLELKRNNIEAEELINKRILEVAPDALNQNMDITEKLMLLNYYAKSEEERQKEIEEAIPLEDIVKSEGLE